MKYSVEFRPAVFKSIKSLPLKDLRQIRKKINSLAEDMPEPSTTKMKGNNAFHKIRSGDYRIICEIHNDRLVVLVVKIGHRKDIYKKLL